MTIKKTYKTLTDIGKVHSALIKLLIPTTLNMVLKEIVRQAVWIAQAEHGTIFLFNRKTELFDRAYTNVPKKYQFDPRPHGYTFWVFSHNRPKFVTREKLLTSNRVFNPGVNSVVLIPLSLKNKGMGVLSLQSTLAIPFSQKQKETLLLFGSIASLAIKKAQLHDQKQKALETRDLFMSAASHEFKTPLSSIRAYAELTEQRLKTEKYDLTQNLRAIIRNTDRLTGMINSLFMASQVSAGTFKPYKESLNLFNIINQAVEDLQVSSKRQLNFTSSHKNVTFFGDKNQLVSVVSNILRNALNYSPPKSSINISLRQSKKNITLLVTNEGKGIDPNDIKRLFEKYFRPKHKQGGLGLGLFLCHQILKAHNGTIKIKSEPNINTTVTVTLPYA